MSFNATGFLDCAKFLLNNLDAESSHRSAVSRAYYSSLHTAIKFHDSLPSMGTLSVTPGGTHETIIQRLSNPTVDRNDPLHTTSRKIAYILREMRMQRCRSDYELVTNVTSDDARSAIAVAEKIASLV